MALYNIAPAKVVVELNLPLRRNVRTRHTVPGVTNNLMSMNKLDANNYITIVDNNKVSIYDATNTEVSVSC